LSKLLTLLALIGAVWWLFRWVDRFNRMRRQLAEEAQRRPARPTADPFAGQAAAEDMTRCPVCGVYVPARQARACGRADCPAGRG